MSLAVGDLVRLQLLNFTLELTVFLFKFVTPLAKWLHLLVCSGAQFFDNLRMVSATLHIEFSGVIIPYLEDTPQT